MYPGERGASREDIRGCLEVGACVELHTFWLNELANIYAQRRLNSWRWLYFGRARGCGRGSQVVVAVGCS